MVLTGLKKLVARQSSPCKVCSSYGKQPMRARGPYCDRRACGLSQLEHQHESAVRREPAIAEPVSRARFAASDSVHSLCKSGLDRRVTRGGRREKNLGSVARLSVSTSSCSRSDAAVKSQSAIRGPVSLKQGPGSSPRRSPPCLHRSRPTRTPNSRLTTHLPSSRSPRRRKRSSSTGGKSTQ